MKVKPATLDAAYLDVMAHKVMSKKGTPMFANDATVLAASAARDQKAPRKDDKKSKDAGKKKPSDKKKDKATTPTPPKAAAAAATTPSKKQSPKRDCAFCSDLTDAAARRHYPSDCPHLPTIKEMVKDGTIAVAHAEPDFEDDAIILTATDEYDDMPKLAFDKLSDDEDDRPISSGCGSSVCDRVSAS